MRPERFRRLREVLARRQPDLTVLMDRVNKAHNFSAILRNCDAVGVLEAHAVAAEPGLEVHHATSAGTKKWVSVRRHTSVEEAVEHLRERGFRVLAAHPAPDAVDYREADYTRPVAITLGAELEGVSPEALERADVRVRVPMVGMVHSLNVSVASSLLLFEAFRQRTAAGLYEQSRLPADAFEARLFEWAYPTLARSRREQGLPYPRLDAEGQIIIEAQPSSRPS
ncbi:MAG TPA: tRNA (guanosine(18)-2'-O)-methyltransferase TrmH [Longimicrobiales bacterium]|nr:tRNA (guanosine(18)-2'-O)-methyltransferase TrmH [Longimicrobiales bacterium]